MRPHAAVLLLLLLGVTTHARAQQGPGGMQGGDSAGNCATGRPMEHGMLAGMDSMDARLDSLATAMASATGSRKLSTMSALLSALVTQHLALHRMRHEQMMGNTGTPDLSGCTGAPSRAGPPCTPGMKDDSAGRRDEHYDH